MTARRFDTRTQGDFLARMAEASRARAEALAGAPPLHGVAPPLPLELSPAGFDLVAELKRSSPAAGRLARTDLDTAAQARAYARGGAVALSVLTEPDYFDGALPHVTEAAGVAGVPVMRKDFLVAPLQVDEARAAGASGVLLIAAMLSDDDLHAMLSRAAALSMFVLLEAFDAAELARGAEAIRATGPAVQPGGACRALLGLNCRDLRTLKVDYGRFEALAPALPDDIAVIAESGVDNAAQCAELARLGYRGALVGTALMRAADPAGLAAALLAAGRA